MSFTINGAEVRVGKRLAVPVGTDSTYISLAGPRYDLHGLLYLSGIGTRVGKVLHYQ